MRGRIKNDGKFNIIYLISLLIVITLINTILVLVTVLKTKNSKTNKKELIVNSQEFLQINQAKQPDSYNSLCPDIEMVNVLGEKISLSSLVGDVIILRFTRFHPQDIPYLLFLDLLGKKLHNKGLHLFIINSIGRNHSTAVDEFPELSATVVDDDGYVAALFQARLNVTIIVGRDFRIKIKSNNLSNRSLYNQVIKYLFDDSGPPGIISDDELGALFKKITIRNIESGKLENLGELIDNKTALIHLFISACFGCPEHQRIQLMKEISLRKNLNKNRIILLFGRDNSFELIRKFSEENELHDHITVGVIQRSENFSDEDYYQMFKLDIDPRMFIFKKGKIVFSENLKNQKQINIDSLGGKLT